VGDEGEGEKLNDFNQDEYCEHTLVQLSSTID
jgi:hypothetical protein